ncbi:TonB-dependent receptor [Caulobacter sp. 602-1]|uniref:TonB-dependent receptor n=1 Tax=Caulobacter sp. 602-1 TaxID=2492472 RepID=UPI000F642955|nr:TonB-dependent receptor [Caulobacter sp. 602-1]RRN63340.1 TonB-dependent receptor [Caulobacter sp. 602-1]
MGRALTATTGKSARRQRAANRLAMMGGVAIAVLAELMAAGAARAQAAGDVGEVVVTARRRAEQLRDVPAAVTAITEADRQGLVLDRMEDYLRQIQGVTLVTSGPEYLNDISIRGQGSGRVGFTETATGLYRDGLYSSGGGFGGRSLTRMDLFDNSRVEVLRGPQGALFGRNAVGGAVNVISNTPKPDFGGTATVRRSDPDRTDLEAIVNLPLTDKVAARLGGFISDQHDGFIVNTTTGNFTDTQDSKGARLTIEARPSSKVTLGAMAEYYDSSAAGFTGLARSPTLDPGPDTRANQNREGRTDIKEKGLSLRADVDLGWADMALRASHRERDGARTNEDDDHFVGLSLSDVAPGAAVAYPDYSRPQFEDYRREVLQATFASKPGGRVSWLFGAEYLNSRDKVVTEPLDCPAYTGAAQPATPGCFVGTAAVGAATTFSAAARQAGRGTMNHDAFDEKVDSVSLFGAVEAKLAERWLLGLELRAQHDSRDYDFQRWSEDPLVYFGSGAVPTGLLAPIGGSGATTVQFCPPTLAAPACAAGNETATIRTGFDNTFYTPTVSLRWNLADEQNIYWRFATAYRSGGFNTNLPPSVTRALLPRILRYDAEYAYNYETGWKGRLFGFNAEAAVYYTWTNQVQVVTAPAAGSSGFILSNAGDAHVYGFEAEARRIFRVGPGRVVARVSYSTSDGAFEKGASLISQGVTVDLNGKHVPRLRDNQVAASLLYTQPIGRLRGFAGVSAQYAHGGFETPDNSRPYAGYTLYDARLGVEGQRWRFSVTGRNLTNERYVLNVVGTAEFWNQPRVYGAELTLRY